NLVFWGGCYGQVASLSTHQSLEKLLVEENVPNVGCLDSNDEVAKIREKFDLAKQRLLNIPDALEKMPKMNPKGIYVNKKLRLDSIQVYGLDYDYTFAHYSPSLQNLIYDIAKQHLGNEVVEGYSYSIQMECTQHIATRRAHMFWKGTRLF
ncbi:haloacid dehalogenase-like domain-containing protein, partial [Tanacetum coccineum]